MGNNMALSTKYDGNSDYDDAAVTDKSQSYRPCSLDELVARTKFEKKEIQVIYQGFKQECPSGTVNEKSFKNIFGQFFPFGDTSKYAHLIFSTFELRSSGIVTFEDFLIGLSTLCRGTIEDRLKWVFKLYDTKKTGRLTRDDFHVIVCAVYSLLGNVTNHCNDYMTIQEHTATVFQKFDKLHQGYITIEDFIKLCMQDPMIVQSIDALRVTI
ncbi:unnamed protein product [Rotaria magnacalcarata]|uniref:EF-hand domain-containing protein n=1 Tax=Rotaria magnacalcarata TaxID=392030 RepID=A0A818XFW0_9BILA|nr:unnamed protein product [Rotaria magnacalcarata]CAF3742821.1 unnamed protein product [Rotaria magnacalcarata]